MKPVGTHIVAEFHHCGKEILNDRALLEEVLRRGIEESGLGFVGITSHAYDPVGVTVVALISESHVAVHTYPEARHASIDVFTCSPQRDTTLNLLHRLKEAFSPATTRIAEISRGNPLEIAQTDWIMNVCDAPGFDIRYHVKKRVYSGHSRYQQIDIIDNETFGRMLFLNQDLQIAEADADLYNRALIDPLLNGSSSPGRVAILGGGDGGTLREVLRHNPAEVTLVDIDEEVVAAAREYLAPICGEAFDDPRVRVVHADAYTFLEEPRNFDAVVYDLTMNPEAFTALDREDYLEGLFARIHAALVPGGILSAQCCSAYDEKTRDFSARVLGGLFVDARFTVREIPSFLSPWVFATARRP